MQQEKIKRVKNKIYRFDFTGISAEKPTQKKNNSKKVNKEKLTPKEMKFCQEYIKTGKTAQSVIDAGYNVTTRGSAGATAAKMLRKPKIQAEIKRLMAPFEKSAIATGQEAMEMATAIARGETKDQFGLEIAADTRLKAIVEILKRTYDIDKKFEMSKNATDNTITIKLDFSDNDD